MKRKLISLFAAVLLIGTAYQADAQFGRPQRDPNAPFSLTHDSWNAKWISVPDALPNDYGIYYFRKDVNLASVPSKYVVHVTGDTRYKLYVNEQIVSMGPAKGDETHWHYETVDLKPYLKAGNNVIAALVFNEGLQKTDSFISVSTGFLLQGVDEAKGLYTDKTWKCIQDPAYSPVRVSVSGYYVAGPSEKVDMSLTIKDWYKASTSTASWKDAREGQAGMPKGFAGQGAQSHLLIPSILPQMERTFEPFPTNTSFTIPANSTKEIIVDMKHLTNAYFTMNFSGGKGADVQVGFTEAFYVPAPEQPQAQAQQAPARPQMGPARPRTAGKGNRNEYEGKIFIGRVDELLPDGTDNQTWTSLTYRTYRYVKVDVKTADQPLTIKEMYGTFTGYPFKLAASLDTDNQEIKDIFDIDWRTARLCAFETYMDCPFYEQLQYFGDARIQALVSLFNTGDDRMVKNLMNDADWSIDNDGITLSRYPTTIHQYIQTYALTHILTMQDYLRYGKDTEFLQGLMHGAEGILEYYMKYTGEDGRVQFLPGWVFTDWVYGHSGWGNGTAINGSDGSNACVDLYLLLAYQAMTQLELARGNTYHAGLYTEKAKQLSQSIRKAYWVPEKGLFADRIEKDNFSQHAGALAILCGLVEGEEAKTMAKKLLSDDTLAPCSVYYKYYLHEALVKAGLGNDFLSWLDVWRENLALGMTTVGETSDVNGTRSDCHAWGASPNIEFFRTLLGIDSDAIAFKKVKIEPHLGNITKIGGTMPHPDGEIKVSYNVNRGTMNAEITLPASVSGKFVWNGKEYQLKGGKNTITAK